MDTIELQLKWRGDASGRIYQLKDNGITIEPKSEDEFFGKGSITVTYTAEEDSNHYISWEVLIPSDAETKECEAWASLNDSEAEKISGPKL